MSGIEQDQEKLVNGSAQVAQNLVATTSYLSLLKKSSTKVEIKTAKDEVSNTQKLLKQGTKIETIKNSLKNSSVAQSILQAGGNLDNYINLIIKKSQINNAIEQKQVETKTKKISKKL